MAQPRTPAALVLDIKGLSLNPSTFGGEPGALTIANNVVIDRHSVVETRHGYSNAYTTITGSTSTMFQYNSTKFIHTSANVLYSDILNNGTLQTYAGTYAAPNAGVGQEGTRIRSIETNKSLFFATDAGTYRLDSLIGTPRLAGVPPGLNGTGIAAATGTGWFVNNTQVAYRVVFGYRDANKKLVLGAPSSRIIVSNSTGSARNAIITFQYPKEVQATPGDFIVQIYRSGLSANLTTEPNDELFFVYETICSTPTISATGSVTITDIVPLSLTGDALYTNTAQGGILLSNYRPPWSVDVATYKQFAFYANTRTAQTGSLSLIASGIGNGTGALQINDTITFTENLPGTRTFTMTAVAGANDPALGQFKLQDSGGSNPSFDIQITANNICLVANAMATNLFIEANYVSQYAEIPGKMIFNALTFSKTTFNITSSRSTCWGQPLPIVSSNDERANSIYYSKFNQPDSVPLTFKLEVGSANQPIFRIMPLRNGLMVLKQDGAFYIQGSSPDTFSVTSIDNNLRILAPNTAAELDNNIYFLSNQGVVSLSDSAAQIQSYIIDKTIIENTSPDLFPNLKETAWGLAYQSGRKYILAMPTISADIQATQQYVYNHLEKVWVRWTLKGSCGLVLIADDKMYMGSASGSAPGVNKSYIYKERKGGSANQDYVDNQYTANNTTVGSVDTIVIDNPSLPAGVSILKGWSVTQSATGAKAQIISVSIGLTQTTLVFDKLQTWALGSVVVWTPVYSEIQTIQLDARNPGMNKQFSEIIYVFTQQNFTDVISRISCDTSAVPIEDVLLPNNPGGWGISPWGPTPWGGGTVGQGKVRRFVPQAVQRCGWLYINVSNAEAFTSFGLSGFELMFKQVSTRQM